MKVVNSAVSSVAVTDVALAARLAGETDAMKAVLMDAQWVAEKGPSSAWIRVASLEVARAAL